MDNKNKLAHGGRITKHKGQAASYAPSFALALAPAFKRAALALLSSATIAILATAIAPSAALAQQIWDGETDNEFSTATNWDNDLPFSGGAIPGNEAIINDNGANAPLVSHNQAVYILDLNNGTLTIIDTMTLIVGTTTDISGGELTGLGTLSTGTYTQSAGVVDISTINASTAFNLSPAAGTLTLGSTLTGAGALTKTGAGVLTLSGNNTFSGGLTNTTDGSVVILQNNAAAGTGTITTGNLSAIHFAGGLAVGNNFTLSGNSDLVQNGATATLSGILSGGGGINKTGTGIIVLSGVNSYTGNTVINAGVLNVTGSIDSNVNINNGQLTAAVGALDVSASVGLNGGIFQNNGNNTIASLTSAGSATINLNAGTLTTGNAGTQTIAGNITGAGNLTKQGAGVLILTSDNATAGYSGVTQINAGVLAVGVTGALGTGNVFIADSAMLHLSDSVNVGNSVSVSGDANMDVSDDNSAIYSGQLFGDGTLIKTSTGTLTLNGDFDTTAYDAMYVVNAGTLAVSGGNALDDNGSVMVEVGATLQVSGAEVSGALNGLAGSFLTLNAGSEFQVNSDGSASSFAGVISGAGALTKQGIGDLTLTGTNTYTGLTTISAGTLSVRGGAAIADAGAVNVDVNGTLNISRVYVGGLSGGYISSSETIGSLAGAGTVNIGVDQTLSAGGNNDDTIFSGLMAGSGVFSKTGTGTLEFSGNNSSLFRVEARGGTIELTGENFAVGNGFIVYDGATLIANNADNNALNNNNLINVESGGTFRVQTDEEINTVGGSGSVVLDANLTINTDLWAGMNGVISGTGNFIKQGIGTLYMEGANTYTGATIINDGILYVNDDRNGKGSIASTDIDIGGTGTLQADAAALAAGADIALSDTGIFQNNGDNTIGAISSIAGTTIDLTAGTLTTGNAGNQTIAGNITGAGALSKQGTGTLNLTEANTYTGATTINAGIINVTGSIVSTNININGTGTLAVGANAFVGATTPADINLSGTGTFQNNGDNSVGVNSITSVAGTTIDLAAGTLSIDMASNQEFAGLLTGAGSLTKQGDGTLTLSGINNNLTGGITLAGGTLSLQSDNAAGGAGNTITTTGSTIDYADGINNAALININSDTTKLQVITGSAEQSGIISEITGSHPLEKIGAGELILSAENTYTGLTTITAGTLSLTGGAAIADAGAVAVGASGTLNIMTSETIGAMNNAGIINLQNSAIGNNLTIMGNYENSGTLKIDVNNLGASDTLAVTGTVTLGGVLDVFSMGAEADYPLGDSFTYTIIENDANDAVTGTFASIENNFAFLDPTINTSGGDGNDVVLTLEAPSDTPDFKPFASNANQSSVAIAFDSFNYDSANGQIVRNAVIGLSNSQAEAALVQFSGADHEASSGLGNIVSGAFRSIMMGRSGTMGSSSAQSSLALGYAQAPQINNETLNAINEVEADDQTFSQAFSTIWTKAFASYSSVDGGANSANIYAFNAGVVFGGEISDPNLGLFGVSAGYSGSKFSTITAGATSKADNFHVGLYGMWGSAATAEAGWGLSGALDYTYNMYETRRPINVGGLDLTAAADYGGYSIGGEFKARYGFESEIFGSNSIISPFAGVNFLNSKNNAFSETGAGALNISAAETDSNRIASLLGFEISSQAIMGETPVNSRISVGWQHEFGDVNQINSFRLQGSPTQFLVASPKEARDKLVFNAGLDFATSSNAMLTLSANGEASATSLAYGGSISYKLQF